MLALDQQALERRSLARNEALFRQGDKVTAIYFIETGRLRLDRRTFDGRTLIVGTAPAGEFFVEAALFADIFRCDAVATEPSRVRIYPKTTVLTALRTDSASAMSFLALVGPEPGDGGCNPRKPVERERRRIAVPIIQIEHHFFQVMLWRHDSALCGLPWFRGIRG